MGSSAAYELSILLTLQDRASQGLSQFEARLRSLDKTAKAFLSDFGKLSTKLGGDIKSTGLDKLSTKYHAVTKDIRALGSEQGKLARRFEQPISTTGLDAQIGKLREYRRTLRTTATASDDLRGSMRGRVPGGRAIEDPLTPRTPRAPRGPRPPKPPDPYTIGERFSDAGDFFMGARQVGNAWRDRINSLEKYTDAATRLIRSEARLKLVGLTADQLNTSFGAINKTARDVRSVSRIDLTEGFLDLYGALGDVNQAARALPSAAKYMTTFRAFFGDKFGAEGANRQLLSSYKALEYMGATQRGEGEMDKTLQELVRITASTGGRVTPDEVLTMLRRGKVATRGLSVEGLRNVSSLIEDYGAPTTGTALMSLYQTLVAGQMKESAAALYQKYGLLKPGGFTFKKGTTTAAKVLPGGNILGPLLQEDPMKAAAVMLEHLRKGGVDVEDEKKLREVTSVMFGNRNSFALMDTFMTQRLQVEKEAKRMGVSADVYQQSKMLNIDPELKKLQQLEEYKAQIENFQIAIGQNLLPLATNLMGVLTPITSFFSQYPTVAKFTAYVLLGGKALGGILETASIFGRAGSGVFNFFRRTRIEVDDTARAMGNAERRAGSLGGTMRKASGNYSIGLRLAVYGVAIETLLAFIDAIDKYEESQKNLKRASKEYGESLVKEAQSSREKPSEFDPTPKTFLERGANVFGSLDPERTLMQSLRGPKDFAEKIRMGASHFWSNYFPLSGIKEGKWHGLIPDRYPFADESKRVQLMRERGTELGQSPELMAATRAQFYARPDVTPDIAASFDRMLQASFSDTFQKSNALVTTMVAQLSAQMSEVNIAPLVAQLAVLSTQTTQQADSFSGLFPKVDQTGKSFDAANESVKPFPTEIGRATRAAQDFADKLWNIQIPDVIGGGASAGGGATSSAITNTATQAAGAGHPAHATKLRAMLDTGDAGRLWKGQAQPAAPSIIQQLTAPAPHFTVRTVQTPFDASRLSKPNVSQPAAPFVIRQPAAPLPSFGGRLNEPPRAMPAPPSIRPPAVQVVYAESREPRAVGRSQEPPRATPAAPPAVRVFQVAAREPRIVPLTMPGERLMKRAPEPPPTFISSPAGLLEPNAARPSLAATSYNELPPLKTALDSSAYTDASSSKSEKHFHITLNVEGGTKDPEKLADKITSKLAAKIDELERTMKDRRHFDLMYKKAKRNDSQRA